jgi:hypothetical protein
MVGPSCRQTPRTLTDFYVGTKDLIHQIEFALEVKAKVIPLYEKVFDVAFPLPKLDTLVAHDFDAGAMENWGLITGRKQAYCLDPNSLDLSMKMWIAAVQSHECAHMWFGNITTMAWCSPNIYSCLISAHSPCRVNALVERVCVFWHSCKTALLRSFPSLCYPCQQLLLTLAI